MCAVKWFGKKWNRYRPKCKSKLLDINQDVFVYLFVCIQWRGFSFNRKSDNQTTSCILVTVDAPSCSFSASVSGVIVFNIVKIKVLCYFHLEVLSYLQVALVLHGHKMWLQNRSLEPCGYKNKHLTCSHHPPGEKGLDTQRDVSGASFLWVFFLLLFVSVRRRGP